MTQRKNIIDTITSFAPKSQPSRGRFLRARYRFQRLQIQNLKNLHDHYQVLSKDEKFVALSLFMRHEYRKSLPILYREIRAGDPVLAGIAGGALAMIGGDHVLKRIIRLLHQHKYTHESQRTTLANALGMLCNVQNTELWVSSLLEILENRSEPVECRMSAAEGLANALIHGDRRSRLYRNATRVLVAMLVDSSPDVRACSAFALGQLEEKRALMKLEEAAKKDHAKCRLHLDHPGGWTVSMEANEALEGMRRSKRDQA